jgi:short subunit dehydrogenase-like uncharacterized protein
VHRPAIPPDEPACNIGGGGPGAPAAYAAAMDRDLDLIVYGATGFTGRLVCEHLVRRAPEGLRWAVAGRSADKLAEVSAGVGADVEQIVADSSDPASIAAMAARTRVVCTTVGPYALHGTPVVEACVEAGTDYCDLTGEAPWMQRMIDAHQRRAQATGARIVHACGFDSIPSDLGTMVVQQAHHERHGRYADHVSLRVKAMRGTASGGTVGSLLNAMDEAASDPAARRAMLDPYALLPEGERQGPQRTDAVNAGYDPVSRGWIGPFVMAAVNCKVVRRTNALQGYPYGREFRYDEAIMTGVGPLGAVKAGALTGGLGLGLAALAVPPVRRLAARVLPQPGDGPTAEAQERGFFDIRVHAVGGAGEDTTTVTVHGDRDPGYGSTSKMLGEAALCLLEAHDPAVGGGFWTPASAMGQALVDRLQAHAGVTFTVR